MTDAERDALTERVAAAAGVPDTYAAELISILDKNMFDSRGTTDQLESALIAVVKAGTEPT